jgi:adenylate cyclase
MKKFKYFHLSNEILGVNLAANLAGRLAAELLGRKNLELTYQPMEILFGSGVVSFLIATTLWYEVPIRRYLKAMRRQKDVLPDYRELAKRRLLNEPYFLILVDLSVWFIGAVMFGLLTRLGGESPFIVRAIVVQALVTGLITVTLAFFWIEHILQRRMTPIFFPQGRLHEVKGVWRIRIGTRLTGLIFAGSVVPLTAIYLTIIASMRALTAGRAAPLEILERLQEIVLSETLIFMGFAVFMTMLVGTNFTRPLKNIIGVLQEITQGIFDRKVPVTSNDEIGYTGDVINEMTEGLKERDMIKDVFGKYVAEEVRDEVLAGRIPLDGEKKEVTVLFSDLRNFTPMTESNDPKLVVQLMNSYFKEMTEAIHQEGGVVLQFLGDEIYAVFGAPISRTDHPLRAFRAGMAMMKRLVELNKRFIDQGWPTLQHGIGIHTGEALAANIGSPDRLSYLLVGDTVNLASRLQSLTKEIGTELILSNVTHERLTESELADIELRRLPPTKIKGRREPVEVFAVA